jgi:hypothetical protein
MMRYLGMHLLGQFNSWQIIAVEGQVTLCSIIMLLHASLMIVLSLSVGLQAQLPMCTAVSSTGSASCKWNQDISVKVHSV